MTRDRQLNRQVIVRMPAELHDAVKAFAAENDRTMAQEVRRALRMYLEQFDAKSVAAVSVGDTP